MDWTDSLDPLDSVVCRAQKVKKETRVWPHRKDMLATQGCQGQMVNLVHRVLQAELVYLVTLEAKGLGEKLLAEDMETKVSQVCQVDLV